MSNFQDAITFVLKNEGTFVHDKNDPGGATKYGISLRFLEDLPLELADINFDGEVDVEDIRQLSIDNAIEIYRVYWWEKNRYLIINNQTLATKIFDLAVNMGSRQAHKCVQRALRTQGLRLKEDGILGEKSFYAIDRSNPEQLHAAICSEAAGFYRLIANARPTLKRFLKGWLNRAYSIHQ